MTKNYDWSSFYNALGKLGPRLLKGIDDDMRELIEELASTTDMFWSDGLQDLLEGGAEDGDLRAGVLTVLQLWRENMLQVLDTDFSIELNWKTVSIDSASPLINELVEAATPS